jgi:hypothetical protein
MSVQILFRKHMARGTLPKFSLVALVVLKNTYRLIGQEKATALHLLSPHFESCGNTYKLLFYSPHVNPLKAEW